jgi:hypothetical protein
MLSAVKRVTVIEPAPSAWEASRAIGGVTWTAAGVGSMEWLRVDGDRESRRLSARPGTPVARVGG